MRVPDLKGRHIKSPKFYLVDQSSMLLISYMTGERHRISNSVTTEMLKKVMIDSCLSDVV